MNCESCQDLVNCSSVYVTNSTLIPGEIGVFAECDFDIGDVIEHGIVRVLKHVDGNENPHVFTWSDDIPNTSWAMTSGCATFYNSSNNANVKMVRDFNTNTYKFIALKKINKDDELFHLYKSISWRECFDSIKHL